MSILVHPPLILLAVMFILGVVDFDDQLIFRSILPERFMVNKLDFSNALSIDELLLQISILAEICIKMRYFY